MSENSSCKSSVKNGIFQWALLLIEGSIPCMLRIIRSDVVACESSACRVEFIAVAVLDSRLVGELIADGVVALEYFDLDDWYVNEDAG